MHLYVYINLALEVLFNESMKSCLMINEDVCDIVATHCTTAEVGCSSYYLLGVATSIQRI